ncbi:glycosyltransferase family 2 protein [Alicyclobacillus vulcanalis]|uniref:Glycosyltransferase involved in cell wall bisynthesis n=1 Tax=Alicyclobacillus vulcanalis TaxID=252246 RepID=A0A1N7LGX7_9BACL|nr:glycosyltransferase family 2 protein [Alicyclobacillus vulcanalis]SIS73085.1 Glycosyltransferase involved in cell wall bisynthesis [Alicyclobacillus vulcanalis]
MNTDATPRVTVVIAVHNRAQELPTAMASVFAQTTPHWRLLVVDDGSTDESAEVARRHQYDERVHVLSLRANVGLGNALQAALEHIHTPYFVTLDSDDWFAPTALEELLAAMDASSPDAVLVSANAQHWREEGSRLVRDHVLFGRPFADKFDFFRYGPYLVPRFYRTEAVRRVGGFERDPAGQGRVYEDKLILLKLAAVGRFLHVDRVLYHVRLHSANLTRPEERARLNAIKKAMYERMMREWGNPYEIVWKTHPEGWLDVADLVPRASAGAQDRRTH